MSVAAQPPLLKPIGISRKLLSSLNLNLNHPSALPVLSASLADKAIGFIFPHPWSSILIFAHDGSFPDLNSHPFIGAKRMAWLASNIFVERVTNVSLIGEPFGPSLFC